MNYWWMGLDVSIYHAINDFCGWSPTLDRVVVHTEVLKGSLFMGIFGVLRYQTDKEQTKRRETLILIVLAVAVALVANRAISPLLPFRLRPMYDPAVGAHSPTFE